MTFRDRAAVYAASNLQHFWVRMALAAYNRGDIQAARHYMREATR